MREAVRERARRQASDIEKAMGVMAVPVTMTGDSIINHLVYGRILARFL